MDAEVACPAELASAAEARRFAESTLQTWGCDEMVEPARLLISELVVNAVRHAGSEVTLRLALRPDALRVEVEDSSSVRPERRSPDLTSATGRGLMIVEALAAEWGVDDVEGGKVVWFELAVDDPDPAMA
jgi:anti-sigma regulatory factor (Ser/Thr protein kinase)